MEPALNLDTTFLIDLERERLKSERGPASGLLAVYSTAQLWISTVAWGEFLEGAGTGRSEAIQVIRSCVELVPVTEAVAEVYARLSRILRSQGHLIGSNDLWIAAVALQQDLPLVTRNRADFARIPDLRLVPY